MLLAFTLLLALGWELVAYQSFCLACALLPPGTGLRPERMIYRRKQKVDNGSKKPSHPLVNFRELSYPGSLSTAADKHRIHFGADREVSITTLLYPSRAAYLKWGL